MNDHYYTESPSSQSRPAEARFDYRGRAFTLISDAGVFSRGELDSGTRILLSALPDRLQGRVLDLGCGWGPVGVALGALYPDCQIVFTDVNLRALAQGLYNRLGAGKIPVRHPHGQIVWADKARVPFYAAGVLALNASVKKCFVVLHQVAPPFMQRITQ